MAKRKVEKEEKSTEDKCDQYDCKSWKHKGRRGRGGGGCGAIYGFGLIGALVYFFQHLGPSTFGNIIMAIIKSIAWPALFVYKFLEYLRF